MTDNEKNIQPGSEYFGGFSSAFRVNAHILIHWGYRGAFSRIQHDLHHEPVLTGYIAEAIKNRLRGFDCPRWCKNFFVMENRPEQAEGYEGNKRKQPDLVIEGTMPGRPEYEFEAKRLKKNGFGIGEYLGGDGLGCFITGKYAARYNEAAMLGYIQSGSPADWKVEIREKINRKKTILDVMSLPQDVEIISDFPNEWKTIHRREEVKESAISIFHILLDFRPKGSPAASPVL